MKVGLHVRRAPCVEPRPRRNSALLQGLRQAGDIVVNDAGSPTPSARSTHPAGLATEPLRIAVYSPRASHLEPALAHGGDPILLDALFAALRARRHEVRVVSRASVRDLRRGSAPVRRLLAEARAIRAETKRFAPHGWIVYNPSPTHPDLFGWWQRSGRYVVLAADTWQSRRLKRPWRWLFAFAFRQSLRRAHRVSVVRPAAARRIRKLGAAENRLELLPPGVPVPASVPSQQQARSRVGLARDECVVLAVSRFTADEESKERKTEALVNLLAVFSRLPVRARLVIVGDGPGRPRIEEQIRELRLADRVTLPGAVEREELTWWFAACDVYAFPDLLDRPRLSMLDAQACGRPVVALRTESAELIVAPGRTGILAADLDEFQAELSALAADKERCEAMGRQAREYVARHHSIDARARQIEDWLAADR